MRHFALALSLILSTAAFSQVTELGRHYIHRDAQTANAPFLMIWSDNDAWEAQYPPGVWHRITVPGIPDNAVAVQLNGIPAISMGYWVGLADLMIYFRTPGAPEPASGWTWQAVGMQTQVTQPAPLPVLKVGDCPRVNATAKVGVVNRQIEFKWLKRVNYVDWPQGAPNWPNFPSMGCGTYWSEYWLAPQ